LLYRHSQSCSERYVNEKESRTRESERKTERKEREEGKTDKDEGEKQRNRITGRGKEEKRGDRTEN
jgi:hypothetical protein